ncbi:MAG: hypothetical protein ACRCYO_10315, partial [Bacteroidia bacterium]
MRLQHLSSLIIATILLVSAFFTPLQFVLAKKEHQQFMQGKSKEPVIELRFSKANFNNPEKGPRFIDQHEFDFEGHRYDVIQSRIEGNEIVLTCRQDDHEQKAELAFAKNQHTGNKSIKAQKLIDDYLPIHSFTLQRPTGILIQQN